MQKLPDEADPRENLTGGKAAAKIAKLAKSARICLFGTKAANGLAVRPMAIQDVDKEGNVWFLSGRSSAKNRQIARNPRVQLLFANPGDSEYLNLHGVASISDDRAVVKEHWTPIAKSWFHEGVTDPEATVIKVRVESGYYWNTQHGKTIALLGEALGALTGKTMDNSVEGTVKPKARATAKRKPAARGK